MSRVSKVSLYHRDANGYHRCDPRGIYPADSTTFVLRYEKERDKRTWERLPPGTDFATARRMALEKELFLSSHEGRFPTLKVRLVPMRTDATPAGDRRIRIAHAIEKYIDALWAEGNQRPRTIKDKAFELGRWAEFTRTERKKEHVEDLVRADLLAFRDWLYKHGYADWTVESNLMSVTTCLKHNPLRQVTHLLKTEDWPRIEDTEPRPYTPEEVRALLSVADEDERLLIKFLVGSGCREQEVAHLEWDDVNFPDKTVSIRSKPRYGWRPKTRAGTRTIPLSDSLIADLKARRESGGLVFPAPRGGVDMHLLRVIQSVAERAGVEGAGLHRCRDTFATEALRAGVDLLTVARWLGHRGLGTVKLYAEALQAKDRRARDAVNRMDDRYVLAAAAD